MRVSLLSDVHLEFGPLEPGTGEVLILAGDIMTASECFTGSELEERYLTFFNQCVANYDKVFYTLGNHEHYNYLFNRTLSTLRSWLPEGVTLLYNQSELYNGVHFVGATLWTDFDGGNPDKMTLAEQSMNDYRCVYEDNLVDEQVDINVITPQLTYFENKDSVEWLKQVLPTLNGKVFVFTHHAPSKTSSEITGYNSELDFSYSSDLDSLIEANPNVAYWAHGHIHDSVLYRVGTTSVISNPRGYDGHALNPKFDLEFSVTV